MIPTQLKPKYKPLVLLKTDVWSTLKTKKLKKKKWRVLIGILKRKRWKKIPSILNYQVKTVPKFPLYSRYRHQKNLIMRTKIKLIYGSLQDYKIKYLAKNAGKGGVFAFTRSLEQKVFTFLYRIGLTITYGEAKIHYIHKRIFVNSSNKKLYIKKGDVLHFSSSLKKLFIRRVLTCFSRAKNYNYMANKVKLIGHNTVDFDVGSFRFYFIDDIKYHKNHPFVIPFEKTWRYYTRV